MIIDIVFVIIMILAIFKGLSKGLMLGIFSLLAFIIGLAAALKLSVVVAAYLKADKNQRIEIYGHTDNAGDEKKNKELSYNRAKAVADYLISKGVKISNVSYEGFGSSRPIESNDTEAGRKSNRHSAN